jgi:hypothetical protein
LVDTIFSYVSISFSFIKDITTKEVSLPRETDEFFSQCTTIAGVSEIKVKFKQLEYEVFISNWNTKRLFVKI